MINIGMANGHRSCAAMAGIDPAIVSRAQEIEAMLYRKEDLVAICGRMTAREVEELEQAVLSQPLPTLYLHPLH